LTRYPGLNDYARIILEDREGTLWVGTWGGLYRFDRDNSRFVYYQRQSDDAVRPASDIILSIFEDSAGALWLGTFGGGLCRLNRAAQTFACYREEDGLPNDVVYGILEDDERNLWLSTNRGLSKFNPQTESFNNYDAGDGLQSNEFNAGAYFKSDSGEMFFGGINGFNAFFPEEIKDNPYVPPVVLTALTQGGEEVDTETAIETLQEVTISWPKNFFEFEFTALNYRQSEKNQYAYMLEGFDEDWIYAGARRFGRYTNLPGGTYTLRIKGSNNDGVWNEEGASIKVTVTPPLWETWWFRGIAILLLAGVVLGGYRLRVKNIEAHNRELETLVQARTRALEQRTRELERRRQVSEGLREILLILNSDESLKVGLDYIVSQAALLSKAEDAIVFRYRSQKSKKQAEIVASSAGSQTLGLVDEWISEALLQKQPLIAPDLSNYSFLEKHFDSVVGVGALAGSCVQNRLKPRLQSKILSKRLYKTRSPLSASKRYNAVLGIPLSVSKEIFGGLVLFYTQKQSFSEQDIELGFTFAEQATLAIANAQLRDRAEQMAVETERSRLARDLHDAVTQTLFSASLIAEVLPKLWERNPEEGRRRSKELRELTRGALAEMRTLLLELRPSGLVEAELGELLRQLTESITGRARLPVTAEVSGACNLSAEVKVALYRIAQEALNNVAKHAGATQALVKLQCQAEQVTLIISDDGRGFAPENIPPESLGLGIMRERADAINATLQIDAQPGCGTQIIVVCELGNKW